MLTDSGNLPESERLLIYPCPYSEASKKSRIPGEQIRRRGWTFALRAHLLPYFVRRHGVPDSGVARMEDSARLVNLRISAATRPRTGHWCSACRELGYRFWVEEASEWYHMLSKTHPCAPSRQPDRWVCDGTPLVEDILRKMRRLIVT